MRLLQRALAPIVQQQQQQESSGIGGDASSGSGSSPAAVDASLSSGGSSALEMNLLTARAKRLRFDRSPIHDWGLFAAEPIGPNQLVLEYLGELVRPRLADLRESAYERIGIGSSYLFRCEEHVIDATVKGSVARFINHSCDPNCAPRVISVGGRPRIAIYSRRRIAVGEELSYDYKFPLATEDEELIRCLCGAAKCHGYLNWVGPVPPDRREDSAE